MADDSLDDFFAKKDKSKKKSKSGRVKSDDILAEQTEKEGKKGKKSKKEKEAAKNTSSFAQADDDWKEVEEEEEKDYSGLRIANLQISERETQEEGQDEAERQSDDDSDDDEGKEKKENVPQGPWSNVSQPASAKSEPTPVLVHEPAAPVTKTPGKYVPPAARAAASSSTPTAATPLRRPKKTIAPNLTSEVDFPTLGAMTPQQMDDGDRRKFEKVITGGRQMEDPNRQGLQLSLENKYAALQD